MMTGSFGGRAALWTLIGSICVYLVLPSFIVVPMSFNESSLMRFPPEAYSLVWYEGYFKSDKWKLATLNSFVVAIVVAAVTTVLGTMAAISLARGRLPLKSIIVAILVSPMVVPPIVSAVGFYSVLSPMGLIGTIVGLVLAHTVLALPFVIINVWVVLQGFDARLEHAARSLGASQTRAFLTVTLPLIRPGVLAGAIFAFITSFDEVIVALFITGIDSITLPVQMWSGLLYEVNPIVAVASTMLLVVSTATLVASQLVGRGASTTGK